MRARALRADHITARIACRRQHVSKVRIYELAKETGLPNKEVIRRLVDLGIDARSHSSTVESVDASRFRESLGKQREAQRRAEEERARREAEQYDLSAVRHMSHDAKARRILPPHLRRAQASQDPAAPEARRFRPPTTPFRPQQSGAVSVGGEAPAAMPEPPVLPTPPPAPAPEVPQPQVEQPAAEATPVDAPVEFEHEVPQPSATSQASAVDAARAGLVRPRC